MDQQLVLRALDQAAQDGARRASLGLTRLLGQEVALRPALRFGSVEGACAGLGGPDTPICGTQQRVDGEVSGTAALFLPRARASKYTKLLCGDLDANTDDVDELELSAVCEMGNIICSAFVNALGDRINTTLSPSPPDLVVNSAGAAVAALCSLAPPDELLLIQTHFEDRFRRSSGLLLLVPDASSLHAVERAVRAA